MKKKPAVVLFFLLTVLMAAIPVAASDPPAGGGLEPGEHITFTQDVPIHLVFIGYDKADVDEAELLGELPGGYTPLVRFPQFYGVPGRDLGLHFNFDYQFHYTNHQFENRFFSYLKKIGEPGNLTDFQQAYNDQASNVLDVTGPVLYIDGPRTERWLNARARGQLGIDTEKGYTIFFVNWYGRDDFKFHVYTKTDEPDPDTGWNRGVIRASRKMIAWGGSYSRTWFYDLSAGPEYWSGNYIVDFSDLDGNGVEDYRMPPIWEYTADGYRDPDALSSDLGLITRFVGINLLFTPSPLYDPLVTTPGLLGDKVAHIEMFEDDPAASGLDWIDTGIIYEKLASFEPYYGWQVHLDDNEPIDPAAQRAFRIFKGLIVEDDCWNPYGIPFAEMFCFFDANYDVYVPEYGEEDYTIPIFAFNTTDENLPGGGLGFADDNWVDGTQTYIFIFDIPFFWSIGYGFSSNTVHEVGHHIGLSHPHDGYDAEYDIDFVAADEFYYAWSGDESNTVMHYLAISNGFSQFDRDTIYRLEMAGYLNWSNELLALILADPDAGQVQHLIDAADAQAALAIHHFDEWHYLKAVTHAYYTYQILLIAAEILGIEPSFATLATNLSDGSVPRFVDHVRSPDN